MMWSSRGLGRPSEGCRPWVGEALGCVPAKWKMDQQSNRCPCTSWFSAGDLVCSVRRVLRVSVDVVRGSRVCPVYLWMPRPLCWKGWEKNVNSPAWVSHGTWEETEKLSLSCLIWSGPFFKIQAPYLTFISFCFCNETTPKSLEPAWWGRY